MASLANPSKVLPVQIRRRRWFAPAIPVVNHEDFFFEKILSTWYKGIPTRMRSSGTLRRLKKLQKKEKRQRNSIVKAETNFLQKIEPLITIEIQDSAPPSKNASTHPPFPSPLRKISPLLSQGLEWSSNSCAVDCILVILISYLSQSQFQIQNHELFLTESTLASSLYNFTLTFQTATEIRDEFRKIIIETFPQEFKEGQLWSASLLLEKILENTSKRQIVKTQYNYHFTCSDNPSTTSTIISRLPHILTKTLQPAPKTSSAQDWIEALFNRKKSHGSCTPQHRSSSSYLTTSPPILFFEALPTVTFSPSSFIYLPYRFESSEAGRLKYTLLGIIYHGSKHFTCRIRADDGTLMCYDGLAEGESCGQLLEEGRTEDDDLSYFDGRKASIFVYALSGKVPEIIL